MDDKFKLRFTAFVDNFMKFCNRLQNQANNIKVLGDRYGNTPEIISIAKDFYQTQIDEAELFKIIYNELLNDENMAPQRTVIEEQLQSINTRLYEMKQTARQELEELGKVKLVKSKPTSNKTNMTEQLLNVLGLGGTSKRK